MTPAISSVSRPPRLTLAEVEHYHSEGYVLPHGAVYSDEKFQDLLAHFEKKLADWPKDQRPEAMDTPHFGDPKLNEWSLAPEVVDLVEPLLGPDIPLNRAPWRGRCCDTPAVRRFQNVHWIRRPARSARVPGGR